MDMQMQKQRQGRAAIGRVPARWQGRQLGGGDRCLAQGTSFGRLRYGRPENFRKESLPRNARHPFNQYSSLRRDLPALPARDGRLVHGRREELAELGKGHAVVLLTIKGYGGGDCLLRVHGSD